MSEVQEDLKDIIQDIQDDVQNGEIPEVDIPTRTKSNIVFDDESDVWVYGDRRSTRSGKKISGVRKLLQMAYTTEFVCRQLDEGKSSTLRELYYQSESWEDEPAHFSDQDESNDVIEELEILSEVPREHFNLHPEESGASLVGDLRVEEETNRGARQVHCQEVGQSGYTIPNDPEKVSFIDHDLDFVIAVETGGMRDRLVEEGFDDEWNCLVLHTKGQPARATKRIIHRLNGELELPVVVFCDGDPWSYRIFSAIACGSIKAAHLSERLATPDAQYLGIEPSDIRNYDLPSDPLSDRDIQALENELDDPRFDSPYWKEQIQLQLDIGMKAEQQSLASRGLDYVTETYLPEKLEEMDII